MWCAHIAPMEYVSTEFEQDELVVGSGIWGNVDKGREYTYCTNIKTGKSTSGSFPFEKYLRAEWDGTGFWMISLTDDENGLVVNRIPFFDDHPLPTQVIPLDGGDHQALRGKVVAMGKCVLYARSGHLESYDSVTGEKLDSLALPGWASAVPIARLLPANRVLLVDMPTPLNCVLVEVANEGELKILANWPAIDSYPFQEEGKFHIASLLPGGMTIEVRNATDGMIVSTTTFAPDPSLPLPLTYIQTRYPGSSFLFLRSVSATLDVFTGRKLPIPPQFELVERDVRNNRLIAFSEYSRFELERTCLVLDAMTGSELARFKLDRNASRAKVLKDPNELAIATTVHRVLIVDVRNGKLLRTIDPYAPVRWSRMGVAIAFVIWSVLWVRFFATVHPYAWVDSTVCVGVFMAYLTYCSYHDVNFRFGNYLFMFGIGALIGSMFMTCVWLSIGQKRFSVRVIPLLLTFGLSIGLTAWWVADERAPSVESVLLPTIAVATFVFTSLLLPLRWLKVRFCQIESKLQSQRIVDPEHQTRVDLRDIFLLTVVCAILFSILRWIPLSHWYFPPRNRASAFFIVGIHFVLIAGLGLFGLWISMSRRKHVWFWGLTASCMLFVLGISLQQMPWIPGEYAIAPSGTYLSCLLGLYAYRLRGWRFAE
ncbi:MAG: hypothetical protein ABL921_28380 [Pirellula sp.]